MDKVYLLLYFSQQLQQAAGRRWPIFFLSGGGWIPQDWTSLGEEKNSLGKMFGIFYLPDSLKAGASKWNMGGMGARWYDISWIEKHRLTNHYSNDYLSGGEFSPLLNVNGCNELWNVKIAGSIVTIGGVACLYRHAKQLRCNIYLKLHMEK